MKMISRRLLLISLIACLGGTAALAAQGYYAVSGLDFLTETNHIFKGTLVERSYFPNPVDKTVMTRYVFQVEEVVKGPDQKSLEVVEYGGEMDGLALHVAHVARYVMGQRYVVFTYSDLQSNTRTFAGELGNLPVTSGSSGEEMLVIPGGHPLLAVLPERSRRNLQTPAELLDGLRQAFEEAQ